MQACSPVPTPISFGTRLSKHGGGELVDSSLYRSMVGGLRYVTCTRLDILFLVEWSARFMDAPTIEHMVAYKRILRYLKGTLTFGLWYASSTPAAAVTSFALVSPSSAACGTVSAAQCVLFGYSDSDWGGDVDNRKSTTGFLFSLGSAPFSWVSKLQPIVTLSSSEAEYIAMASCTSHALWLRQFLAELKVEQGDPTVIFVDNQSAIAIAKNPVYHDRSKHIDVRFHFLRDAVANDVVKLEHVKTQDQLADLLTKPLATQVFTRFRSMIGLVDSSLRGAYVSKQA
ncbi:hypothetical protein Dimus_039096 [Dionaea muscipula]